MAADRIYLGSASPRRRELLQQIGVQFTVVTAALDESVLSDETPLGYVSRLARSKALAVFDRVQAEAMAPHPVLGADTCVVLGQRILGKPANEQEAVDMLLSLSGEEHQVITAVALVSEKGARLTHSVTDVVFRSITREEASAYWRTGEPADKAGGYGIQGFGAVFVQRLSGSYSGVVGLPLFETAQLLQQAGVNLWQPAETNNR